MTLKVSKAKASLPSRKLLQNARIAERSCAFKAQSSTKAKLSGPLLPTGEFLSSRKKLLSEEFSPPSNASWRKDVSLKGNWEPVYLKPQILGTNILRKLSKNPGRAFKDSLLKGSIAVYPNKSSVRVFHRKSWALNYLYKVVNLLDSLDYESLIKEVRTLIPLFSEVFRERKDFCTEHRSVRNQLFFSMRRATRDQNQDQRSRREALKECHIIDLFSSDSS